MNKIASYFNMRAGNWDAIAEAAGTKHAMMAMLAGCKQGSRVLDVGCGTGIMTKAYLDCDAEQVTAIDLSQEMVARARAKFPSEGRVTFICGDVVDLEGDELFDVVVMYNVYPHIIDKKPLVKAVRRLLVPGGRFLVAHGMGREALNAQHRNVPADVTSTLEPAQVALADWEDSFDIDTFCDNELHYFFGGTKKTRA